MVNGQISIEGAKIVFRNFSGKEGKYNAKGRRNFCVLIPNEQAKVYAEEGWNIKYLNPRDEYEDPQAYLQVSVAFGNVPPKIFMITSNGKTQLNEDDVHVLDWAEIANADIVIRPYNWEVNGKSGVKAYVKSLYITIQEDEFEKKYRDRPDSALSSMVENDDLPF